MSAGVTAVLRKFRCDEHDARSLEFATVFCVRRGFGRVSAWSTSEREPAC